MHPRFRPRCWPKALLCAALILAQAALPAFGADGEARPHPSGGSTWSVDAYQSPAFSGLAKERLRTERNAQVQSNVEIPAGFEPRKPRPEDMKYRVIRCLIRHVQGLYSYHEKRAFFSLVGRIDLATGTDQERLRVASSADDGRISSTSKNRLTLELPADAQTRYAKDLASDNFCSSPTMSRIYRLIDADSGDSKRSGIPQLVQEVLDRGASAAGQKSAKVDPASLPYRKVASTEGREEIVLAASDTPNGIMTAASDTIVGNPGGVSQDPSGSGYVYPLPPVPDTTPVESKPFLDGLKSLVKGSGDGSADLAADQSSAAQPGNGLVTSGVASAKASTDGFRELVKKNLKDDGVLDLRLTLGFYDDPNPVSRAYAKQYPQHKGKHAVVNMFRLQELVARFVGMGFAQVPPDAERLKAVGVPAGAEKLIGPNELTILEKPAPGGEGKIRIAIYNSTNAYFTEDVVKDPAMLQAQLAQSARARAFMKEAFRKSEGFIYFGHSRYGKGPDTYPMGYGPSGKLTGRQALREQRGLNDLKEAAADRKGVPPVTTSVSCDSCKYFAGPLRQAAAGQEAYFVGTTRYPKGDKLVDSTVSLVENLINGGTEAETESGMSAPDGKGVYRIDRLTASSKR